MNLYNDLAASVAALRATFESDAACKKWLTDQHELLGGLSPVDLLAAGRGQQLHEFVLDALAGQPA